MLGLGPYLGGVSARAVDRTFEVRATLGPEAVEDLVTRLGAMVALARAGSVPGFAPPPAAVGRQRFRAQATPQRGGKAPGA